MTSTIRVHVRLFSVLRERVGQASLAIDVPAPATGGDVLDRLADAYEAIRAYRPYVRLAVNRVYVPDMHALAEGDEVALITPVSGG